MTDLDTPEGACCVHELHLHKAPRAHSAGQPMSTAMLYTSDPQKLPCARPVDTRPKLWQQLTTDDAAQ